MPPRNAVDTEQHTRRYHLQSAAEANQLEIDALRRAILYQVPDDRVEAIILAAMLHTTFGLTDDFHAKEDDEDRLAFETGLETLIDFLIGESDALPEGRHIDDTEKIVRLHRELRTGVMEASHG